MTVDLPPVALSAVPGTALRALARRGRAPSAATSSAHRSRHGRAHLPSGHAGVFVQRPEGLHGAVRRESAGPWPEPPDALAVVVANTTEGGPSTRSACSVMNALICRWGVGSCLDCGHAERGIVRWVEISSLHIPAAADDAVIWYVFGDDSARGDDRPGADVDAGRDRGVRADPDVGADDDRSRRDAVEAFGRLDGVAGGSSVTRGRSSCGPRSSCRRCHGRTSSG